MMTNGRVTYEEVRKELNLFQALKRHHNMSNRIKHSFTKVKKSVDGKTKNFTNTKISCFHEKCQQAFSFFFVARSLTYLNIKSRIMLHKNRGIKENRWERAESCDEEEEKEGNLHIVLWYNDIYIKRI